MDTHTDESDQYAVREWAKDLRYALTLARREGNSLLDGIDDAEGFLSGIEDSDLRDTVKDALAEIDALLDFTEKYVAE